MGVQFQDYYETLGVTRTASQDEIQKHFGSWPGSITRT